MIRQVIETIWVKASPKSIFLHEIEIQFESDG